MLTFPSSMERARDQAAPRAEPPVAAQPNGEREKLRHGEVGHCFAETVYIVWFEGRKGEGAHGNRSNPFASMALLASPSCGRR
jgi:hypothetical protein